MFAWAKIISLSLSLLDFIGKQIERGQIRDAKADELDAKALRGTMEGLRNDKELEARILADPALIRRLRKHYTSS